MSPEFVGLLGIILVIACMLFRMWIGLAMAFAGSAGLYYLKNFDVVFGVLGSVPYNAIAYYPMSAIPMFIFMATIITGTGIGASIYASAHTWMGPLRGGLAMASVIACAGLAAIMGNSVAQALTMGKIAVPEMKRYNYDLSLASGCVAAGWTLGILIPPSLGFIMYGILTEQPVGALFIAGIIPGILLTSLFILIIWLITLKNPAAGPPGPSSSFKQKVVSLKGTWHTILLFTLIIGGIYAGIFTPTEAGAIGAFFAILIAVLSGRMSVKKLIEAVLETAKATCMIIFLITGAMIFMKFLALSKLPFWLANHILALALPKYGVFFAIILLYIVLGMFLDVFVAVILTIPVIFPIITALGFDPIWFGVIIVLVLEMGLITPPMGLNVYVLSGVTDIPLPTIFRGVIPFVGAMLICVVLLAFFPWIALFLPSMM